VQTLTFNGNVNGVPLTIQIGSGRSLYLGQSDSYVTAISVAQTNVTHTIAADSGASIQFNGDQEWSVNGTLEISAAIWDPAGGYGESGNPVSTRLAPTR